MDYKGLAEKLVKHCLNRGAEQAEVYFESGRELSVQVREGNVESVEESASRGAGFRILKNGRLGFAHCNDLSEKSLQETINHAVEFASITTPDEHNVLPGAESVKPVPGLFDAGIRDIPMERKIAMARETEKLAMKDPRITKSAGAGYSDYEVEIVIANSRGLVRQCRMSSCHVGVSVVAEKGDQKSQGAEYCVRRNFKDLKTTGEIAAEAAIKAYKMLDPRMVKTQKAALIVDPDASRSILRGILSAMDGERALKGASYLRDRKGKAVASSLITLIDDGQRPRGTGSAPFDGEGVPTRKRVLLEKGVLKGFMYNCAAAHRAGEKSTGNASRYSFSRLPGIGAHNFYMTAGKATRDEVIRSTRRGLLLKGVTGYGINPVNGHFSGGASGFWIEDGEIVFPVKGLAIAGTADEMLMSVDIVADDLDLEKSFTAPTFRIPEIQIGGE